MQPRRFYLNTAARAFVASPQSTAAASGSVFFGEDVESIELYFVEPTNTVGQNFRFLNYAANTVKMAVGLTAPAALQTAWTAVSTAITPSISTLTNGGGGANEVQRLTFSGNTPATGSLSLTMPSRAVTVSSVSAGVFTAANHGLLNGQQIALSAFSVSGSTFANSTYFVVNRTKDTFGISATAAGTAIAAAVTSGGGTATLDAITTPAITEINAENLQQAFVDAGIVLDDAPQIIVSGSYAGGFDITFANSQANINFGSLTASSTLAAAPGLAANLSFNTTEVGALISAGTTSNLRLEVEVSSGSVRQTYATTCSISADIIASSSAAPLPTITPATSFNLISPDTSVWNITIDNSGILTASKV